MQLPGGLLESGQLRKGFAFKGINGELELALAECDRRLTVSEQVTRTLVQALDHLAGDTPSHQRVAGLCVGDRQYLMRQLTIMLGHDRQWMNADCGKCGETFDFHVRLSELPIKSAAEDFPEIKIKISGKSLCFRLPTGEDQQAIANEANPEQAQQILLQRCLLSISGKKVSRDEQPIFAPGDVEKIEAAMEAVAPELVTELDANCPVCGQPNKIELDPYVQLGRGSTALFSEIHSLAWYYHWSEREILAMPRARRARYLSYIDRSRGFDSRQVGETLEVEV